jgi:copper homeostasis protein (lipoprotein)
MKFLPTLLLLCLAIPTAFGAGRVTGTAAFRERIALPPDAVFEAMLEDISRADAPAEVLGQVRLESPGNPPIRFEIPYDAVRIQPNHSYSVRARILAGERLLFTTDRINPVLTRGHGEEVTLILRGAGGTPPSILQAKAGSPLGMLPASFVGELPCADCPGIRYRLDLLPDQVFFRRMEYLDRGRAFDDIGTFAISPDGATLLLSPGREPPAHFAIRDTATLRPLDADGREIPSRAHHDLKRTIGLGPLEPRLVLRGMYRYMADAGIFTECRTRRPLPVAQEQDNAALEAAYGGARRQPGEEVLARVEGRIALRPNMEGQGLQPTLIVDRFIEMVPGETCGSQFGTADLENTLWRLTLLNGQPVSVGENQQQAQLVLQTEGRRVHGSGGCNRLMGSYRLDGDRLAFGPLATTRGACPSGMETEQAFLKALEQVRAWKIEGEHLELFGAGGERLARFEALYLR